MRLLNCLRKLDRMRRALSQQEPDRVDFFWGSFLKRWRQEFGRPHELGAIVALVAGLIAVANGGLNLAVFVAFRQKRGHHVHVFPALLDVAQVIDDQPFVPA